MLKIIDISWGAKLHNTSSSFLTFPIESLFEYIYFIEPNSFETVSVTTYGPEPVNTWLGFWAEELEPSPKSQAHSVGCWDEKSLKATSEPEQIS